MMLFFLALVLFLLLHQKNPLVLLLNHFLFLLLLLHTHPLLQDFLGNFNLPIGLLRELDGGEQVIPLQTSLHASSKLDVPPTGVCVSIESGYLTGEELAVNGRDDMLPNKLNFLSVDKWLVLVLVLVLVPPVVFVVLGLPAQDLGCFFRVVLRVFTKLNSRRKRVAAEFLWLVHACQFDQPRACVGIKSTNLAAVNLAIDRLHDSLAHQCDLLAVVCEDLFDVFLVFIVFLVLLVLMLDLVLLYVGGGFVCLNLAFLSYFDFPLCLDVTFRFLVLQSCPEAEPELAP
mmetsp:Transcript_12212/g.24848  ORF Transcript_12212/g.24848 Transcript_12212/m.24848 type:complete len:287 (+) Transcript_12212:609-1469(+)